MNKYKKWYDNICLNGQKRITDEYTERHHIVPESFYVDRKRKGYAGWLEGNSNAAENLTRLTDREHELAHYLLTKIHKDDNRAYFKVLKAYEMRSMVNHNQQEKRHFSSRRLAGVRAERAKLQSEAMKGEGNPMYNKTHTADAKDRIRQKNLGNKLTPEQHAKLVKNCTGKKKPPITEEHRAKLSAAKQGENNNRYGVKVKQSTRDKIGAKIKGRKQTEEEKQRRGLANMGKVKPKKLCPHCDQMIAVNGYARFHGDKCKKKPK